MVARAVICALSVFTSLAPTMAEARDIPSPVYGVTIDSVSRLGDITKSLDALSKMPTTRIVFDEFVPPSEYATAINRLHPISYIMGEILDSSAMSRYTVTNFKRRVDNYLNAFPEKVDIWEIGNEINGEWLGSTSSVVAKMAYAFDAAKARGKKTALTLYYNPNCFERAANEMFTWVRANVPARMLNGLDYVLVSYYEDDCNGFQPNWQNVFDQLGVLFPNSLLGVGECGTEFADRKATYIRRYYNMVVNHHRFVGGQFWWYYKQDMVPMTKANWKVINGAMVSVP